MLNKLDLAIQFSDLFEQAGMEGGPAAQFIDSEIMPALNEGGVGLGDRFAKIIDAVKAKAGEGGADQIRRLKALMKEALSIYVKRTNDALTAREIYHRAITAGTDAMLTVTASVVLANALCSHGPGEAEHLLKRVLGKLSGEQIEENASGAATGAGAIATVAMGIGKRKKRRKDSIFAEDLSWRDLEEKSEILSMLEEIAESGCDRHVDGVLVDPTTAELVVSAHRSLDKPEQRKRYQSRPVSEMIEIAHYLVRTGRLQVVMEEG